MDGGRVLCDKCWKNMYLPKVCVTPQTARSLHLTDVVYPDRVSTVDYVLPQILTRETKSLFAHKSDTIVTIVNLEDRLRVLFHPLYIT